MPISSPGTISPLMRCSAISLRVRFCFSVIRPPPPAPPPCAGEGSSSHVFLPPCRTRPAHVDGLPLSRARGRGSGGGGSLGSQSSGSRRSLHWDLVPGGAVQVLRGHVDPSVHDPAGRTERADALDVPALRP